MSLIDVSSWHGIVDRSLVVELVFESTLVVLRDMFRIQPDMSACQEVNLQQISKEQ